MRSSATLEWIWDFFPSLMIGAPVTIFLSAGAALLVRGVAAWQTGYWGADARLTMHRVVPGTVVARIGLAGMCAGPPPRVADECGHPATAPLAEWRHDVD